MYHVTWIVMSVVSKVMRKSYHFNSNTECITFVSIAVYYPFDAKTMAYMYMY